MPWARGGDPLFVLKWGAPGSGKSSEKVERAIESLGVPLENYLNYSSDPIIESLIPFRFESSKAKVELERMKANYEQAKYVDVKKRLQEFVIRTTNPQLKKEIQDMLSSWEHGQNVGDREALFDLFRRFFFEKTRSAYTRYSRKLTNSNGLTIHTKMKQVLADAFRRNIHVLYEKSGSGYGKMVPSSSRRRAPLIRDFSNTNEGLLGKIIYESGVPVGIDESSLGPESVPITYRIFVVFPILQKEEIAKRAERRAVDMFAKRRKIAVKGGIEEAYRKVLEDYAIALLKIIGTDVNTRTLVDTAIHMEKERFGLNSSTEYSQTLESLLDDLDRGDQEIYFPLYRMVAPTIIYETIESAFLYSIDYFLKQYLLIGRIQQIIYISNK